jgi:hypothetical protein
VNSFYRTIVGDALSLSDHVTERLVSNDMAALRVWLLGLFNALNAGVEPPMEAWLRSISPTIYGRAMLRTQRDHVGMGYSDAQAGDEIWVLHGGKVPFILRRCSGQGMNGHVLVGDCYLHGFMDGEAIETRVSETRKVVIL